MRLKNHETQNKKNKKKTKTKKQKTKQKKNQNPRCVIETSQFNYCHYCEGSWQLR